MKRYLKILLNTAISLVVIGFIWYITQLINKQEMTYANTALEEPFISPYREVSSFTLPQEINRFGLHDSKLYISAGEYIFTYDREGKLLSFFQVKPEVRDITIGEKNIYVLYPSFIEVYSTEGELTNQWEACSELSDYCSFALAGDFVFVTDAANKNICKYTKEGHFVKFIHSPYNFIIPSYSFDIESKNDTIYCANSGRHLIEAYTLDGKFIAAFGGPGSEPGAFVGCCNPVYLSFSPEGELITSEKGNPRISSFERSGKFKEVLLNSKMLGGGNRAYEVRTDENQLFVAGKNKISIFELK